MRLLPANCLYTILTAICDTFRGGRTPVTPPPLNPPLMILFCPDLNPVDYAVWGILQDRVYKHQRITDVEELCQRVEGEWDRLSAPGSD